MDHADGISTKKSTSASSALEGYGYQRDVSVWVALDLLLARKIANQLVLEPKTEEDLETEIEDEPDAATGKVDGDAYQLVIQCKRRTTGPWDEGTIKRLLAHGKRRKSPKERLKDQRIRYLLVTSADLVGVARDLRVESIGEWPSPMNMPANIGQDLSADAGGRVAVLGPMNEETLQSRTERLLAERFRVPRVQLDACRTALGKEAWRRMLGAGLGLWRRGELEATIAAFGGYAGSWEDANRFVPPTNWEQLKDALLTRHAVVIKGASGTGKTSTAKALVAHLRETVPGINPVYVQGGPEKILGYRGVGPVVFEIEDPWGKFRLEPSALPWNDEIGRVLQSAGPDRKFIVTSRTDILQESKPSALHHNWTITLEDENYGPRERNHLFDNRLTRLPRGLQDVALRYNQMAMGRLMSPLEIERYFASLGNGPEPDESEAEYIHRCLADAHKNSIETSLVNATRARGEWALAAVVWGLFKAQERISFTLVPAIQAGLTEQFTDLEDTLEPFINRLIAGRNLRQSEVVLTYQHPRVELGLENAWAEKPERAGKTFKGLVEVLFGFDENGDDWGKEGAAYLLQAIKNKPGLSVAPGAALQAALDRWLEGRINPAGDRLADDLKLAAAVGSSSSEVSELSRWLYHRSPKLDWFEHDRWSMPEKSSEWYERVSAHPLAQPICEGFITQLMAHGNGTFPDEFAACISRFSFDPTPAFRQAALNVVDYGYFSNDDSILEGAIGELDGFEDVVVAALRVLAPDDSDNDKESQLALANGEYNDEAYDHYTEPDDDTQTASGFVDRYVEERRARDGWQAIASHPGVDGLLWSWMKSLHGQAVDDEEWLAIATKTIGNRHEAWFWDAVRGRLPPVLLPALADGLRAGGADARARTRLLQTVALDAPSTLVEVTRLLAAERNYHRVIELAADIRQCLEAKDDDESLVKARDDFENALPRVLKEAAGVVIGENYRTPNAEVIELFRAFSPKELRLSLLRAQVLAANGHCVADRLKEIIEHRTYTSQSDFECVADAVKLAGQLKYVPILQEALGHPFADAREEALMGLAALTTGPLTPDLLALSKDKGHRVKKRLIGLLGERRHPEHRPTIIELTADTWDNSRRRYNEEASFPIAQKAADLLLETENLDDSLYKSFGKIIKETEDTSVKFRLLQALVRNGSDLAREKVMRLALKTGSPPLHRLAAEALLYESSFVDDTLASVITDEHLRHQATSVACYLSMLVGTTASPTRVIEAAQAISVTADRCALLVPLSLGASFRDEALAAHVLRCLPEPLPTVVSEAIAERVPMAATALDDIGDVRVIASIKATLPYLFVAPKEETAMGRRLASWSKLKTAAGR